MKRLRLLALMLSFAVLGMGASPVDTHSSPVIKLTRGLVNIVTSPLEYYVQYVVLKQEQNVGTALLASVINGTVYMVGRILAGAVEVVTFPIPIPKYYAPVMIPATALEAVKDLNG